MREERKFLRISSKEVRVVWRKPCMPDNFDEVENISEAGICLVLKSCRIQIGDNLFLNIALPGQDLVECKARVVWVKQKNEEKDGKIWIQEQIAGIEFTDISPENKDRIEKFIKKTFLE